MIKIAYLHNLPLEYYPPASNFLDILGRQSAAQVRAFTTANRKGRAAYTNLRIRIERSRPPDPAAHEGLRFRQAIGWHLKTALALARFKPDAVVYVEPHSAIAAWIYFRLLRGKSRLFIHHHEYYALGDYRRPGMRLPRLGNRLERSYLLRRAEWISQTNGDRLRLARDDHPDVSAETWQLLPNYPPAVWAPRPASRGRVTDHAPLRLIYVGSASFADTYLEEVVRWVAAHPGAVELHICGYNVADEVWAWLERERFGNVTYDAAGFVYDELPAILRDFDVGLVLYKGNTTNFVYNVPNKVFEYLRCGLEVWYPQEMAGLRNFAASHAAPLRELRMSTLGGLDPAELQLMEHTSFDGSGFIAERAFEPLLRRLGLAAEVAVA